VASKQIDLPDIGNITLFKRKSTSSIRLSINARGQVKVTMPYWVSYEAGIRFVRSRQAWIAEHQEVRSTSLIHGQDIGKSHRLLFEASPVVDKVTSRVTRNIIRITHPAACAVADVAVQTAAEKASIRALRNQAEDLLPGRLRQLADQHGFQYNSLQIKQLTGRWGSCDTHQNIIFNLYLMQLPWPLIDYVILHELTHTNILRHGPEFWGAMKQVLPDVQVRRKAMKHYRPAVGA
jgi:predicted metal-dependent hydrolase